MRHTLLLIVLLLLPAVSAVGAEPSFRTWAVIAPQPVLENGLADLLTVQLSQDDSIQLVERERLREATRELQLAALLKAESVDQRLRLGETLGADALMVLSTSRREGHELLRVVVCDSVLGVRLWDEHFANDSANAEGLAMQCAAVVSEVRQRFAGGIQRIIAVPPFVSDNFKHQFDYMQARYSDRISGSLMAHPGVAVVEIEEARAILRELEDTLSGGLERPIATIVEGRYRVTPPDSEGQRWIEIQIALVSGKQREEIKKRFKLGVVGHWLTTTLTKRLLPDSRNNTASLDVEAQKAILARHAQRFAELGNWEQSTSLREAALVLDPNDALQRGLLISEYQFGFKRDIDENRFAMWMGKERPAEIREPALRGAAHDYCVALDHLAYLIHNRLVTRRDAIGLFLTQTWYKQLPVGAALPRDPLKFDSLQPVFGAQRQFIRDVASLANALPAGLRLPKRLSQPFYGWRYAVTSQVAADVYFNNYNSESLASLRDLLATVLPQGEKTSNSILGLFSSPFAPKPGDANYTSWSKLITELSESERETTRLYGRYALSMEAKKRRGSDAGLKLLFDELQRLDRSDEPIHKSLERQLGLNRKPRPSPEPSSNAPRPLPSGPRESLGQMQFDPISLAVEGDASSGSPLITGMLQCGERCDAFWTKDRFFVMNEPGVLRELTLTDSDSKGALYWGVTWDGECIWLFAQGQGFVAVRPDGTRVATFNQTHNLPGYARGFQLLGLSPRRAMIVASFGKTKRAWCGILEVDENGKQSVSVFFEAKYVAEGRSPEGAAADPKTAFQAERLHYVQARNAKDYVLVKRREFADYLRIDLETRRVSVAGVPGDASTRTELGFRGSHFFDRGRSMSARFPHVNRVGARQLLFHDGRLYVPGRQVWFRFSPDLKQLERLLPRPSVLPVKYQGLHYGVSAHYGLIGYQYYSDSRPLYQIKISDNSANGDEKEDE